MAETRLVVGQIRVRLDQTEAAEKSLRGAMELAAEQNNFVVERTACFELGKLLAARHSEEKKREYSFAMSPLGRAFELHNEGKGKANAVEHMKVGNAFARELRRMKRFEEAALVFTARPYTPPLPSST